MSGDRLAQIEAECHRRVSDRELRPQLRGEARDVLVLVEIAKAAREYLEHTEDQDYRRGHTNTSCPPLTRAMCGQYMGLRSALAGHRALSSGRTAEERLHPEIAYEIRHGSKRHRGVDGKLHPWWCMAVPCIGVEVGECDCGQAEAPRSAAGDEARTTHWKENHA